MKLTLENIGRSVAEKRGKEGVRTTAQKIGISAATLSRIENGHLPDLETFRKVCDWLDVNPGDILGAKSSSASSKIAAVHFKKDKTLEQSTAEALGRMILSAQRALEYQKAGQ